MVCLENIKRVQIFEDKFLIIYKVQTFFYLFTDLFIYLFIRLLVCLFASLFIYLFIYSFSYSFFHSFIYAPNYSLIEWWQMYQLLQTFLCMFFFCYSWWFFISHSSLNKVTFSVVFRKDSYPSHDFLRRQLVRISFR